MDTKYTARHGRESGNRKTGTGKGCRETGKREWEMLFFPKREKTEAGNDPFSRREFHVFPRPAIWLKNTP